LTSWSIVVALQSANVRLCLKRYFSLWTVCFHQPFWCLMQVLRHGSPRNSCARHTLTRFFLRVSHRRETGPPETLVLLWSTRPARRASPGTEALLEPRRADPFQHFECT